MTVDVREATRLFKSVAYPAIDKWCEFAENGGGFGCKPGCSMCCYNVVTLSLLEAAVLLSNPKGKLLMEANRERVVETANLFFARKPETKLGPWRARSEPCLFLDADDRCSVYEDRPFNCRTHIAVKPCDPTRDGNHYVDPEDATRLGFELGIMAENDLGIPFTVAPMPVALVTADAMMIGGVEAIKKAYANTPFLRCDTAAMFWSYIEL